ncbi:MAG: hypothetical protein Q9195_007204 [Heterodermia aff. obscurata]
MEKEDWSSRVDGSSLIPNGRPVVDTEEDQNPAMPANNSNQSTEAPKPSPKPPINLPDSEKDTRTPTTQGTPTTQVKPPPMRFLGKSWTESTTDLPTERSVSEPEEPIKNKKILLYFLQCSRSIRIAWILEELNLQYEVKAYNREPSMAAPIAFKQECGGSMGKAPVLKIEDLVLEESGAITQYLIDEYDTLHYLLPLDPTLKAKTLLYMHAAEATFFVHGLVPFYVKRTVPDAPDDLLQEFSIDIGADLDWLDAQIKSTGTRFLVSDNVTAADTMMGFSIQFILEFRLHPHEQEHENRWGHVRKWLANIEACRGYQAAVGKTGHTLRP